MVVVRSCRQILSVSRPQSVCSIRKICRLFAVKITAIDVMHAALAKQASFYDGRVNGGFAMSVG